MHDMSGFTDRLNEMIIQNIANNGNAKKNRYAKVNDVSVYKKGNFLNTQSAKVH